jgi:hypothetical protein
LYGPPSACPELRSDAGRWFTSETPQLLPFSFFAYSTPHSCKPKRFLVTLSAMGTLLEDALRKVAALPQDEQDAIASQIIETLEDEAAWKEKLARTPEKLRRLAPAAQDENRQGETRPLDELL